VASSWVLFFSYHNDARSNERQINKKFFMVRCAVGWIKSCPGLVTLPRGWCITFHFHWFAAARMLLWRNCIPVRSCYMQVSYTDMQTTMEYTS